MHKRDGKQQLNRSNTNIIIENQGLGKKEKLKDKIERITNEVKSNYYGSALERNS